MKGLILSGGKGTRLRLLTCTGSEKLIPTVNKPVLYYVLDDRVRSGLADNGVIISPETGANVRDTPMAGPSDWGATFTFMARDAPRDSPVVPRLLERFWAMILSYGTCIIQCGGRKSRSVRVPGATRTHSICAAKVPDTISQDPDKCASGGTVLGVTHAEQ